MAQVSSLMLARFTRLPRRSGDTWQGGVVRMPMWVDGPDGTPYRPWGGVWVSLETGVVNVKLAEADGGDATLALDALLELGFKFARTRPAAIQVADQALGEQIARAIGDPELAVTVDPHLAAVKAMVQRMASETSGAPLPAALDRKGMTVERMRAFAAAVHTRRPERRDYPRGRRLPSFVTCSDPDSHGCGRSQHMMSRDLRATVAGHSAGAFVWQRDTASILAARRHDRRTCPRRVSGE